ncbi:MAG: heme lyase CcmF/NrfE family subunit [Acidimicrobiia bacterium]|nr:MAG: heme lyase CcmF/NrfE family subunit [Acidimicrobiia bacterium]
MIAILGYAAILVALAGAVGLVVTGIKASRSVDQDPAAVRMPLFALFGGGIAAAVFLEIAILTHDFSIAYVAQNSARGTPFVFLVASGWAALEGSVVMWGVLLALFSLLVWRRLWRGDGLGLGALAVMGAVSVFWFGLMATAANPFGICTEVANGVCSASSWLPVGSAVAAADGIGPNPLLANHILMAFHPPMLYLGYVGFTVPFAFGISALARSEPGKVWLDRSHRWSVLAWIFLAAGILLGGWWSYEVLGWGGYWAWDPVENAALLPWLAATAFIHSAIVQRRRSMLQAWNFVLIIVTFALTIFGTFLTRSGVIASVHAFSQSLVGPALLGLLAIVVFGSLGLFAVRANTVASAPRLDSLSSREGFLLLNNLLMTLFAFTVLFGTTFPLLVEAFTGREVSVGRPFFDRVAIPFGLILLLAIGFGSVAPWRAASPSIMWERSRFGMNVGLVAAALSVVLGVRSVPVVAVVGLAGFVIGTIAHFLLHQARRARAGDKTWPQALASTVGNDLGFWGGQLAHVGVALIAVAIATTSALAVRTEVTLVQGETAVVDDYCVEYRDAFERTEPERVVRGVRVVLYDASCTEQKAVLEPRLHEYPKFGQVIATPDVRTGLIDDVYLNIAGVDGDAVRLSVLIFPLQWLVWFGGLTILAGGIVALGRTVRGRPQAPLPEDRRDEAHV